MNTQKKNSILSNRGYDILKWVTVLVIPALGTFYATLALIWGFPAGEQVLSSTVAVNLFLGTILGLATKSYNQNESRYDGDIRIDKDRPEDPVIAELDTPIATVEAQDEVILKVQHPTE